MSGAIGGQQVKDYLLVIFDADGTRRRCTVDGQPCPNKPGEWELLPGVRERVAELAGAKLGIASNQGGVSCDYLTGAMARQLLSDLAVAAFGWEDDGKLVDKVRKGIRYCAHNPNGRCGCRRPKPAMLPRIVGNYGEDPCDTRFVGDRDEDREAAERSGCGFMWAHEFFGWE
jgi:D-glycero-D-manno-heptose 1,7-bisphosphate phosphatase